MNEFEFWLHVVNESSKLRSTAGSERLNWMRLAAHRWLIRWSC
jgi:hypothetical protein